MRSSRLRYVDGRVRVTANGVIRFQSTGNDYRITFRAETGELAWGDIVMAHTTPKVSEGSIIGSGFDNAIGVLLLLVSAHLLNKHVRIPSRDAGSSSSSLTRKKVRPSAYSVKAPRGWRMSWNHRGLDSSMSMGTTSTKPPAMSWASAPRTPSSPAMDAARSCRWIIKRWPSRWLGEVNKVRPGTVRLNYSYVSRGDDMLLSTWTRCLD